MAHCLSTVDLQSELPDYYKSLSLKLYQVMEDSGASTEMRNMWKENGTTAEILRTIRTLPGMSYYHFGSFIEGTTTPIMILKGDIDNVVVNNFRPVITDCSAAYPFDKCLLLVQNNNTQPGYAKLQLVYDGVPLFQNDFGTRTAGYFTMTQNLITCTDNDNKLVISFNPSMIYSGQERHGPAMYSSAGGDTTSDCVLAFNCSEWPACATEWLSRKRNYNWPPADVIETCKTLGCLVVPVGHPHSDEQHLQWRLSFSHQEKLFVTQFNSVQLKCYILLKLLKKEMLHHFIREESLSSYHFKTCMLYMIENTQSNFWRPETLLNCFDACLKLILIWTINGVCPNYFIPAENMFDRRIHGELQQTLHQELHRLITAECKYLLQLQTDNIGSRLSSMLFKPISNHHGQFVIKLMLTGYLVFDIWHMRHDFLNNYTYGSLEQYLIPLYFTLSKLKGALKVTLHTEEETQRAISYIVPVLELHFMTNMIALAKRQRRSREEIWQLLSSDKWNQLSLRCDASVKLKQASLMYMFGFYDASLDVLTSIAPCRSRSICFCFRKIFKIPDIEDLLNATTNAAITTEYLLNNTRISCVAFMPTERDVTPDAIRYELLRYVDAPPGYTDNLYYDYLRNCAVVDGQFLLYFLLYLNHSKLNMSSHVGVDIDQMEWVVNTRKISHPETCLNLLGWAYKDQVCIARAVECFTMSLEIKPVANSAVCHMRDIESNMTR